MKGRLLLITVIMLFSSFASADSPLNVVYFNNYAPFSWEERGEMRGIFIDVLNEVVQQQMGVPVNHQGYPWKRAQMMVRDGKADAFVTVPTQERRSYTEISTEPIVIAQVSLFTKYNNPHIDDYMAIKSIADLKGLRMGNYLGNGWAKENLQGMNVDWSPTLDTTIKNLFYERFDLFVGVSKVALFNIKRLGYKGQIIQIGKPLVTSPFQLCIGKHSSYRSLLPAFDAAIVALKKSGKLQEIFNQYQ